jgi:CPA2 family monovalent cation:H+ antiporter-2
MEIPLLPDIVTIFSLSILVLLICHWVKLPAIVGFIFTGVLCGPHGMALIEAESDVQVMAQLGIILLLFSVGMEFSFKKILEYKRYFLIGGISQVGLTVLLGFLIGLILSRPFGESLFLGFILALSSTAIVVRILDEKKETDSPHGHLIMGMMIFQDIVAIPMMLLIPLLAGTSHSLEYSYLIQFSKGLLILAAVLFSAVKLVPSLLYHIAKTGSRELFLLSVLTLCFAVAWVTASVGLSLSLGAFLAGLTISETEYKTEAIGDIIPFQDIFTGLFFVTIGMLLDVGFVLHNPVLIGMVAFGVLFSKCIIAGFSALILGMPLRSAILTGIAMCQVGEFSFVLAKSGINMGLGDEFKYQLFLAFSLITMALTPTFMQFSPLLAQLMLRLPLPVRLKSGFKTLTHKEHHGKKDHIIIIGYGLSGKNLVRSAKEAALPYVIVDMNAETVKMEKIRGEPINYGDATHENVLNHAEIAEAKVLAVLINDSLAAERIVEKARKLNKRLYILVRTRYLREMRTMIQLGADEVIPDEFGSSVEIFIRVLNKYQIPTDEVQKIVSTVRLEGYEMCRLLYKEPTTLSDLKITLTDVLIETFRVGEGAHVAEKSLGESELRKLYGVNVMLVRRGNDTMGQLDAHTKLLPNDVVVICGTHDNLSKLPPLFKPKHAHSLAQA